MSLQQEGLQNNQCCKTLISQSCAKPTQNLHNKQNSIRRVEIQIQRKQEELERLKKEEKALQLGTSIHQLRPRQLQLLSAQLHQLNVLLDTAPLPVRDIAQRIQERLRRDILVRLGEGAPFLLVGIVGPNNAGKSTLFSQLSGTQASLPDFRGGFTQHLIGACHPSLKARLAGTTVLDRFDVRDGAPTVDAPPHALGRAPALPGGPRARLSRRATGPW